LKARSETTEVHRRRKHKFLKPDALQPVLFFLALKAGIETA
jgi:hypothetical protein